MSDNFSAPVRAIHVPIRLCCFAGQGRKDVRGISTGLSPVGCAVQVSFGGH